MRQTQVLVCVGCIVMMLSASAAAQPAPPNTIAWTTDLTKAMARSKKENRPVIAYFTYNG